MAARGLSADLSRVLALADGRPLALSRILEHLDERGQALVLLLLATPFVLPIPTLGMSAPIGLALAMVGLGLAAGRPFALPATLRDHEIRYDALRVLVGGGSRASAVAAAVLRPRLGFMMGRRMRGPFGLSLAFSALILALPLPLPLSNFFPAAAILLLAAGLLERDGLFVLAGHAATLGVGALLYFSSGAAWSAVLRLLAFVR